MLMLAGNNGVMGGFESLPSPVPASQMVYNHVARAIAPSFAGMTIFPATVSSGAVHIVNYTFVLPAGWDETQIHIVGMLIDPTGKIDNAGTADIATAVANGFEIGMNAGLFEGVSDPTISIAPNPAQSYTQVLLNLNQASDVEITVLNMDGKSMLEGQYTSLNNAQILTLPTHTFPAGVYLIRTKINGEMHLNKLIIE